MRKAKESTPKVNKKLLEAQKAVRVLPEVESFYKFVYENGLRDEARALLSAIVTSNQAKKKSKRAAKILQ